MQLQISWDWLPKPNPPSDASLAAEHQLLPAHNIPAQLELWILHQVPQPLTEVWHHRVWNWLQMFIIMWGSKHKLSIKSNSHELLKLDVDDWSLKTSVYKAARPEHSWMMSLTCSLIRGMKIVLNSSFVFIHHSPDEAEESDHIIIRDMSGAPLWVDGACQSFFCLLSPPLSLSFSLLSSPPLSLLYLSETCCADGMWRALRICFI